jgi:glycosyltransferase involved in cell wall biosynthesis
MTRCRTCLVIPCYNEAQRLDISEFRKFLSVSPDTGFLFVDDGSRDGTLAVLEAIQRDFEDCVQILSLKRNGGKAEAVRLGILRTLEVSEPSAVGFWDADLATPLDAVNRFLRILDRQPEIEMVFGARVQLLGRHVHRSAVRHYLGRIFATAVSVVLELPIYDTQCGAKLFRVLPHTREVFAEPFLSRWVFDVEILARYLAVFRYEHKRLSDAVYEYPLERWVDVAGSKVRPRDFFTAFRDIVRIRAKYLR